jgi:type I restriction enzyme, S subunit
MHGLVSTEIGALPSEWKIVRFDAVFEVQQGKQVSKNTRAGQNQRPFLRTRNVLWGKLDLSELDAMNFTSVEEERLKLIRDDLLICEGGDIGRTAIWSGEVEHCFYQNHLHRARLRRGAEADARFALFWLWYAFEIGNVYFGRGNVTTIPNLSQSKLSELLLPLPSLSEQMTIAAIIALVRRAIAQAEDKISLTMELKQSLLQKLLTEGMHGVVQKETEIGRIPESWSVAQLIDVVEQIDYGISAPIPKTPPAGGWKIVSTADITKDGRLLYDQIRTIVAPERTINRLTLKSGDVLFNWRNSAELIGKTAVFEEQEAPHVFASFVLRIRCDESKSHNHYLAYLMNYFREKEVFIKLSRRAVNQANYNRNEISVLKIQLPPYAEQREIAETVATIDRKIDLCRRKHAALTNLFDTLLHRLMTGQIRVNKLDLPELESAIAA